jgi:hypothetical protein
MAMRWLAMLALMAWAIAGPSLATEVVFTARALPATPESHPYVRAPLPRGYVEQEFLVTADEGATPLYRTVVNVRRPADKARTADLTVVEPWHPGDLWPVQATTSAYLARSGIVSVVVAASPVVVEKILKTADPKRYGALQLPDNPAAEAEILANVAHMLKAGSFPPVKPRKLILAGYSNTAAVVRGYITGRHHPGEGLYDGYLVGQTAVGTRPAALPDIDVPVVEIEGESELIRTFERGGEAVGYRRADGPDYRLYEVPGLSHLASRVEGQGDPIRWRCANPLRSQYPHRETWSALLALLVRWVDEGRPAPHAPRIETADNGRTIVRDAYGNARGGVRSSVLDVPTASITPVGANAPGDPPTARCDMVGWQTPLPHAELVRLYGDHAAYIRKVDLSLAGLVGGGWLLQPDANRIAARARAEKVP